MFERWKKKSHLSGRPIVNDFLVMVFLGRLKNSWKSGLSQMHPIFKTIFFVQGDVDSTLYDYNDENGKKYDQNASPRIYF